VSALGSLAFIVEEEALVVRVRAGWQYVALGSVIAAPTTSFPAITTTVKTPIESSNLINNIPYPVDGPSVSYNQRHLDSLVIRDMPTP